jgi:predicted DNA-binding transcriptional regulator AlpA
MTRIAVDVPTLFASWNNHSLTVTEVARACGVTTGQLYALARQHALPKRPRLNRAFTLDEGEPPGSDDSPESLELSPYVKARIRELRIGMPVAS